MGIRTRKASVGGRFVAILNWRQPYTRLWFSLHTLPLAFLRHFCTVILSFDFESGLFGKKSSTLFEQSTLIQSLFRCKLRQILPLPQVATTQHKQQKPFTPHNNQNHAKQQKQAKQRKPRYATKQNKEKQKNHAKQTKQTKKNNKSHAKQKKQEKQ